MAEGISKSVRYISGNPADLLIEVVVVDGKALRTITFRGDAVDHIQEESPEKSKLVLKSGLQIDVVLPYQELKKMIYEPDLAQGDRLDLTAQTCSAIPLQFKAALWGRRRSALFVCGFSEEEVVFKGDICGVKVVFNKATGPLDSKEAFLGMPYEERQDMIAQARENRTRKVDLTAWFKKSPDRDGFKPS